MKKLFRIYETDDYGRPTKCWGLFIADDENDARQIASKYFNRNDIVNTGYFITKEYTRIELMDEFNAKLKVIETETNILNI